MYKNRIEAYISHKSQLIDVKSYTLNSGNEKDIECIDIDNGVIRMIINVDRGFDIASLKYKGVNISYTNTNGIRRYNGNYESSANLGFLMTCGLDNIGTACVIDDVAYELHGLLNTLRAEDVSIDYVQDDVTPSVVISGSVKQTHLFGDHLVLNRKIVVDYLSSEFVIEDTVINEGYRDSYYGLMYHFNVGYPMLSEDTTVEIPSSAMIPKNEASRNALLNHSKVDIPQDLFAPQCIYHELNSTEEDATIRVTNHVSGIQLSLTVDQENFPYLTQWRMFQKGEYVMSLEPCNIMPKGRKVLIDEGIMPILRGRESKVFRTKIQLSGGKYEN